MDHCTVSYRFSSVYSDIIAPSSACTSVMAGGGGWYIDDSPVRRVYPYKIEIHLCIHTIMLQDSSHCDPLLIKIDINHRGFTQ